jgi:excisionase family DNA binding protein
MEDGFMTPLEVARLLRISLRELARRRHELPPVKLGRRLVRYRRSDVMRYIERGGGPERSAA